ncbi:MAG: DUF308 domain-containing protein [Lachnospiraceae bacterium]
MREIRSNISGVLLFVAIGFIALSILLFVNPIALSTIVCIVGILLILYGLFCMFSYIYNHSFVDMRRFDFSIGLLLVVTGIGFLMRYEQLAAWLPHVLSAAVVISCIVKLQTALDLHYLKDPHWHFCLIVSIVILVFACISLFSEQPYMENGKVSAYICTLLLVDGIVDLVTNILLFYRVRRYFEEHPQDGLTSGNERALSEQNKDRE